MQAYSHKIQDFHGTSPYLRLCLYLFPFYYSETIRQSVRLFLLLFHSDY